ncbi:erythromycin esterase [Streptomyces cinnamoneus]|uniref:Erythromycin esterase n=1 Tax=Streptomyces cinnamoneus TaxID=53446 RepID=A0A2G1XKN2_STRCJ|nr:erythromycin esterase family protein [Streptomyces cinnamoneus]PHQ51699.1 erythromycin esterase [Streptomyces cinnamoneus]PPT11948.1 erythromycin esterase [Streptomyces cinnamoneus]
MSPTGPRRRRSALFLTLLLSLGTFTAAAGPAQAGPRADDPAEALARAASPLRTTEPLGDLGDLRPLGRMVGDASVVGMGEATHSSHEFFTDKHRVFRYLVEEKGFTAFALEAPWSTGLRLNDYVLHGKGDARQIMKEEFQRDYTFWNTREYLDLIEWMRAYNTRHDRKVQFVGDDIGYTGPQVFDEITRYVAAHHRALLPRFTELYRAQRPAPGTSVGDAMRAYLQRPLAERRDMAERAHRALDLLSRQQPGPDRAAFDLAVQHARVVAQTADEYAYDLEDAQDVARAMRHRDESMAANVAWWHERTGSKVLLSAHNAHVAYESEDPGHYPRMQGAFLREKLGKGYLAVRQSFGQGSFNATTDPDESKIEVCTVGPAEPGGNEHTLDRVSREDYLLDLRTAPAGARSWLATARPSRDIGTAYPEPLHPVALGSSYDVLIHLHRVTAARRLG